MLFLFKILFSCMKLLFNLKFIMQMKSLIFIQCFSYNRSGQRLKRVFYTGIVNSRQGLYNGFTNFSEASKALDKDFDTYYSSKEQSGASWFLRLDAVYRLKWILASISGGECWVTYVISKILHRSKKNRSHYFTI